MRTNRRRFARALGFEHRARVVAGAVHGREVGIVRGKPSGEEVGIPGVDALLTDRDDVALLVLGADCPVVFLHDPEAGSGRCGVAGLIHAGWRGLVAGVIESAMGAAVGALGLEPGRSRAAISPSIGPCCFEVGEDVATRFEVRGKVPGVVRRPEGRGGRSARPHVDLARVVRAELERLGVPRNRIEGPGPCTRCQAERFFSHRAARSRTGRGGAMVGLIRVEDRPGMPRAGRPS